METIIKNAVKYFKKNDVNNLDEMDVFFFISDLKDKELIDWDIIINNNNYTLYKDDASMNVDILPDSLEKLIPFIENINKKINEC